jgi:perosamine synthetase
MIKRLIPQMEPNFDQKEVNSLIKYFKNNGWGGEYIQTEQLEKIITKFTGAKYCSMTTNGTISLILGQLALGLKPGDEILIPDMTMIASPNSAKILGINPVLVEVEKKTLCLDLSKAEKALTFKTKAVMYVPFNGRSGNMTEVANFCKKHQLFLIEDAAQALGSYWQKKHLGTFGDIGSFSFSVPKIITTGQGGALITNNEKIYRKIEKIKDFGRIRGGIDIHDDWGWNFKFTDFLAVIGIEQMKKLPTRLKRKKEIYERYFENLKKNNEINFLPTNLQSTTPWFIDIYTAKADKLASFLMTKGIYTRRIYPAIHTQKIYKNEYKNQTFPITEEAAKTGLWLPSSINLTNKTIDEICQEINNYFKSK